MLTQLNTCMYLSFFWFPSRLQTVCTQTVLMGVKPVNVCVCMSVQTLALKKLRCEPCVSNTFSECYSLYAHTLLHFRCRIRKWTKITTISKSSLSFPSVYTSFIHFKRSNLYRKVAVSEHNTLKARKLFVVVVFEYKGITNHLGALTEKGLTSAWITHEVAVPCSPPIPLQRCWI